MNKIHYALLEKGGKYAIKRYEKNRFDAEIEVYYLRYYPSEVGPKFRMDEWTSNKEDMTVWSHPREVIEATYNRFVEEQMKADEWRNAPIEVVKR